MSGSLCRVCVESVQRRGFHDVLPPAVRSPRLMSQFIRLVEEVWEYLFIPNPRPQDGPDAAELRELADVYVVLAQVAHFLDIPEREVDEVLPFAGGDPDIMAAMNDFIHALRSVDANWKQGARVATLRLMAHVLAEADMDTSDFPAVVRRKLAADEQRGRLHQGCHQ